VEQRQEEMKNINISNNGNRKTRGEEGKTDAKGIVHRSVRMKEGRYCIRNHKNIRATVSPPCLIRHSGD
jgi:hypothetical protein